MAPATDPVAAGLVPVGLHPIADLAKLGDTGIMNSTILIKRVAVLAIIVALVAIAGLGCHTANGFGKDMKEAGQGIQDGTK